MALSKASSDEDRTRFFRLSLVILEELTSILRDLLKQEICPTQIFNILKRQKFKKIPPVQLGIIKNAKIEGYTKFDITLLCTILRNYCQHIQQPTQSWKMTQTPAQNEITLHQFYLTEKTTEFASQLEFITPTELATLYTGTTLTIKEIK